MAQGGGLETGAVIVLSSKGLVEVTDPKGKIITKTLKPGMVLAEGFTIRTGITGEMSALFSNGMTATIERQTILKISTFLQEPLQGANQTIEQTVDEPGPTTLALALDVGSLIVESKKLNKDSSFQIQTRVGTAGIRGTQFQLSHKEGALASWTSPVRWFRSHPLITPNLSLSRKGKEWMHLRTATFSQDPSTPLPKRTSPEETKLLQRSQPRFPSPFLRKHLARQNQLRPALQALRLAPRQQMEVPKIPTK